MDQTIKEIIDLYCSTPSIINPTKADIISRVCGIDINDPKQYDPMDYFEWIEAAACIMFPYYCRDRVRQNQKQITKALKNRKIKIVCDECGSDYKVEMHHIVPSVGFDEYIGGNDSHNITFLCHKCHKKTMNRKYLEDIYKNIISKETA